MMSYDNCENKVKERCLNTSYKNLNPGDIPIEEGIINEENRSIKTAFNIIENVQDIFKTENSPTLQESINTNERRLMSACEQFNMDNSIAANDITENKTIFWPSGSSSNRVPIRGIESKIISMWHNMKYGWNVKLKSNFSKDRPVWLLGRCYHCKLSQIAPSSIQSTELNFPIEIENSICDNPSRKISSDELCSANVAPNFIEEIVIPQELAEDATNTNICENSWEESLDEFKSDFYSRIWMTYRREFPIMNGSNYTSDCGWGCMLRSGQMLLAQALICHFLGRDWRYDPDSQLNNTRQDNLHRKIIRWFGDNSSKNSPFSIHTLVKLGSEMGKKPGDWYGPTSVAYLLKRALEYASQENCDFDNIIIYVAKNCTVYLGDIEVECSILEQMPNNKNVPWKKVPETSSKQTVFQQEQQQRQWKSLILLIPLHLGNEKLNSVYVHCLKLLLSIEYCIGIIGGRPKHSLYFVGFQEDKLIHLDPHYCREMVDINQENFPLHSFHCKSPRKLKSNKMDPSCCIGFYCQNKKDFDNCIESVQLYLYPMRCASGTIDKILPLSQQMPTGLSLKYMNSDSTSTVTNTELNYPLFTFATGRCIDNEPNELNDTPYKISQQEFQQTGLYASTFHDSEFEEFTIV